jgi:hypothetical protein
MLGQKNCIMPTERKKMTNKKIFISLPAWEDTELLDTINKSISFAAYPENLVFGICLNYDIEPDLSSIKHEIRIIRDKKDFITDDPGIIRVRNGIRSLIKDEEYYLSIDAHANFADRWDETLINDIEELHLISDKFVISKQIVEPGNFNNYYTRWNVDKRKDSFSMGGQPKIDNDMSHSNDLMVNDKYFLNYYVSCNFIFGKTSWINSMEFPDYHGFPFEEPELSMALFCNGFDVVSPTGKHCPIHAGNDPKYYFPYDEKWWEFIGTDRGNKNHWKKIWVWDDPEMESEVVDLLITGKNKYFSFNNLNRTIKEFYDVITR